MKIIVNICAYKHCRKIISASPDVFYAFMAMKYGGNFQISHGACPECAAKELQRYQETRNGFVAADVSDFVQKSKVTV